MQVAGKALQVQPLDRYVNGQELARAITVALKPSRRKLRWSATIVACGVAVGAFGATYGESAMTSVARFRGVN